MRFTTLRKRSTQRSTQIFWKSQEKAFDTSFTFRGSNSSEVIKLIKTLNAKKPSRQTDIPIKISKLNADFFGNYIFINFNYCLENGDCRWVLKHADFVSVHKKKIKSDKAGYSPVSILPIFYNVSTAIWTFSLESFTKTMCVSNRL